MLKYFEIMLNIFEFSRVKENVESWLIYGNEMSIKFLDRDNKTKRSSRPEMFCENTCARGASQMSQEKTSARVSFLIKLQTWGQLFKYSCRPTSLKKRPWHRCFRVNFVKFVRTPFTQNTSGRLLENELSDSFFVWLFETLVREK